MKIRTLAVLTTALALPLTLQPVAVLAQDSVVAQSQGTVGVPAEIGAIFPEIAASDLPFDTDYRVGRLDNGMRYIIRSNATPPEQGSVYFWVDFGSVSESDDEEGYAHFIEHMAFNGSENIPEGEMISLLEREGLAFGADTNASTSFDTTLYRLDLPRNDMDLLDTALMIMRETASNLTFDNEAVDREKGVVLSEQRVRDTFQLRNVVDSLGFGFPGSRISQRMPIGQIEDLQAATGDKLRDLYNRYYRPDNTAIIVVGDFDADAVEAAVREKFGDWRATPSAPAAVFGPVDPAYAGETRIYTDPALPEQITVARNGNYITPPDTDASRFDQLLRQVGYGIVNRRLQSLSREEDPPFRGASFGTNDFFREGRSTTLTVLAADGEWQRGLAAAQSEYRRALAYGFTQSEVAEQVATIRNAVETNAAGAATRNNATFVGGAVTLLRDGRVPTTPASTLERFNALASAITPEAVLAAVQREAIPLEDPLIRYSGPAAPDGGAEALRTAWNAGMAAELAANTNVEAPPFAYTDFGTPGQVVSDTVREDLGIREVRFANGLMLNLKPTTLQDDRVLVQLNIDGGQLLATRDNPLAVAMFSSLPSGGLGQHTFDELQSVLAGRQVAFNVGTSDDTFRWNAGTTPRDLELQLQLMTAAIQDAAFRPTAEAQYRRNITSFFRQYRATPGGALGSELGGIVSDNDPRFTLQPEDAYLALSFAKLREDVMDRWQNGAMELALVGDIDADAAVALVARTLGTLPQRETTFRDYADNIDRTFTAERQARTIYHGGAPNQALVQMMWPTRDDSDPVESLRFSMLQRVMRLELTDIVREELGQAYSPGAGSDLSQVYPGYGTFDISAEVDVSQVEPTREAMLRAITLLRAGPLDEDVLVRARQPLLEGLGNLLDSNAGWMTLVDRAQTEPDRIERYQTAADVVRAITPEDLHALALRYLDPAERLEFVVLPTPDEDAATGG
ncbi:M16 family metallopeptidase [Aurantiacibacter luteus]|uniref:Peptidase M16 n=1 Tax=Aurantiacibacter luteus TaxID=1581420 RepID=A0A0G9MWJ9_9SPHN|nr:M16 family metallopeptidase [Aurantiacibacter luteus]KLE35122.1 peptidase M16 [Aurantiacibacter luteus]